MAVVMDGSSHEIGRAIVEIRSSSLPTKGIAISAVVAKHTSVIRRVPRRGFANDMLSHVIDLAVELLFYCASLWMEHLICFTFVLF